MIKVKVSCYMAGKNFDPYTFEKKINTILGYKKKAGELGSKGRYKDKQVPIGFGYLRPESYDKHEEYQLNEIIRLIKSNNIKVGLYGIEEINVRVNVNYVTQCNLEFDPSILEELGKKEIPLLISCYKVEEEDLQPT